MKNTIIASSLVAIIAIVGVYALAEKHVSAQTAQPQVTESQDTENSSGPDTDNIQDENGVLGNQDTTMDQDADKETNDDAGQNADQKTGPQGQDIPENSNDLPDSR